MTSRRNKRAKIVDEFIDERNAFNVRYVILM
jgi:hypothetical protein